jgi:hypothetical protein
MTVTASEIVRPGVVAPRSLQARTRELPEPKRAAALPPAESPVAGTVVPDHS